MDKDIQLAWQRLIFERVELPIRKSWRYRLSRSARISRTCAWAQWIQDAMLHPVFEARTAWSVA